MRVSFIISQIGNNVKERRKTEEVSDLLLKKMQKFVSVCALTYGGRVTSQIKFIFFTVRKKSNIFQLLAITF